MISKTYYEKVQEVYPGLVENLQDIRVPEGVHDLEPFFNYMRKEAPDVFEPLFSLFVGAKNTQETALEISTLTNIIFQVMHFQSSGKRVFHISNNLMESLMITDMEKMPVSFLQMPYPCVYLSFNPSYISISDATGWHDVTGLFITETYVDEVRYFRILATAFNWFQCRK